MSDKPFRQMRRVKSRVDADGQRKTVRLRTKKSTKQKQSTGPVATNSEYVLGIDPGQFGGLAVARIGGEVVEAEAFRSEENANRVVSGWKDRYGLVVAFIEKVHAFPGQGVVSAFSFGQNFGAWRGILIAHGISVVTVDPRAWQDSLGVELPGHDKKTAHKNALKSIAASRFPNLKVSLSTSDAILIASYASSTLVVRS